MKLTDQEKARIESQCQPLIEKLKLEYVPENPPKDFNYLADIYTKWNRGYLYFCEKYKSESPDRMADEFEENFVRLKIINSDKFDLFFMSHTEKWIPVVGGLTLNECLQMIEDTPTLHPNG